MRRVRISVLKTARRATCVAALAFALVPVAQASATVTVTLAGSGSGAVTSNTGSPQINCTLSGGATSGTCSNNPPVDFFTATVLTATPGPGSVFAGWTVSGGGCTGLANPCTLATHFGGSFTLTAQFAPPPDRPVVQTGSADDIADWGATLHGAVNPNTNDFEVDDCQFEFGETADYGRTAPCVPGTIPPGTSNVGVAADIGYLEPGTTYHYRLTATNPGGSASGEDEVFTTASSAADGCANASIRAQQAIGARFLPDCMAYEWVSKADSWGIGINRSGLKLSKSGERLQFLAQAIDLPASVPSFLTSYTSLRTEGGWTVNTRMTPRPEIASGSTAQTEGFRQSSANFDKTLWPEASIAQRQLSKVGWGMYDLAGQRTVAHPLITPLNRQGPADSVDFFYELAGASDDLSTFFFRAPGGNVGVSLVPDEQIVRGGIAISNIYAVTGAGTEHPKLDIANRETNPAPGVPGKIIGGSCGAGVGDRVDYTTGARYRAVSADGRALYFSAVPTTVPASGLCPLSNFTTSLRVYRRLDGESTVQVSQSQCARVAPACAGSGSDVWAGASSDGSVAVFTSPRQLTDSDTDLTSDIYVYDFDPPAGRPNLTQASAGENVAGHTVGAGASVTDMIDVSADGSRVYFAATGVLTGPNSRGASPVGGQRNLYVFQRDEEHPDGRIAFIATGLAGDAGRDSESAGVRAWALPAGDAGNGRFLLFAAAAQLVAEDTDAVRDVYRYDDSSDELLCISCSGNGSHEVFMAAQRDERSAPGIASADVSSIPIVTSERLLATDRNSAPDVYLWQAGSLSLISGGTAETGAVRTSSNAVVISPDGTSVYFMTTASLVASDVNRQNDAYVARVGGGFLEDPPPGAGCDVLADGCQGGGTDPTGTSSRTASASDVGNAKPDARAQLALRRPGRSARIRAARTGRLTIEVRSNGVGKVRVVGRARLGGRLAAVGRTSKALANPGAATLTLRLSRPARKWLRAGHGLSVRLELHAQGARTRTVGVRLPGASS